MLGDCLTKQQLISEPTQGRINAIYRLSMQTSASLLFETVGRLQRITVCDRAPSFYDNDMEQFAVSTQPFSSVFFRDS